MTKAGIHPGCARPVARVAVVPSPMRCAQREHDGRSAFGLPARGAAPCGVLAATHPAANRVMPDNPLILRVLLATLIFFAPRPSSASQECAYVTAGDSLIMIETTGNSIAARVPLSPYISRPVALTPDGKLAFVGTAEPSVFEERGGGLDVLDTGNNRVVATIPLTIASSGSIASLPTPFGPYSPGSIAFTPDGAMAYATGTYDFGAPARAAALFVIDVATRQVMRTIAQAENAAMSPDGRTVYAIRTDVWLQATEPPRLLFIDAENGDITGMLSHLPYARRIVVTADGRSAFLASTGHPDSQIIRIDTAARAVAGSIDLAGELTDLSLSADDTIAYATTYNTDTGFFVLLDLASGTEIGTLAFDGVPDGFAMTRDQRRAYILLRPDIHRHDAAVGVVDVARREFATMIPLPGEGTAIDIATAPLGCSAPFCEGDCDDNGQVTVDEMVVGVEMSLGEALGLCAAFTEDDRGVVSIDALIRAVRHVLDGCPSAASPTATVTPTPPASTPQITPKSGGSPSVTPEGSCGAVCDGRSCGSQQCGERYFFGPVFGTALCTGQGADGCLCEVFECDLCGNGIVDVGEECDVGGGFGGMGCAVNCTIEVETHTQFHDLVTDGLNLPRGVGGQIDLRRGRERNPPMPPCYPAAVRALRIHPAPLMGGECQCVEAVVDAENFGAGNAGIAMMGCAERPDEIQGIISINQWRIAAGCAPGKPEDGPDLQPCTDDDLGRGSERPVTAIRFHAQAN